MPAYTKITVDGIPVLDVASLARQVRNVPAWWSKLNSLTNAVGTEASTGRFVIDSTRAAELTVDDYIDIVWTYDDGTASAPDSGGGGGDPGGAGGGGDPGQTGAGGDPGEPSDPPASQTTLTFRNYIVTRRRDLLNIPDSPVMIEVADVRWRYSKTPIIGKRFNVQPPLGMYRFKQTEEDDIAEILATLATDMDAGHHDFQFDPNDKPEAPWNLLFDHSTVTESIAETLQRAGHQIHQDPFVGAIKNYAMDDLQPDEQPLIDKPRNERVEDPQVIDEPHAMQSQYVHVHYSDLVSITGIPGDNDHERRAVGTPPTNGQSLCAYTSRRYPFDPNVTFDHRAESSMIDNVITTCQAINRDRFTRQIIGLHEMQTGPLLHRITWMVSGGQTITEFEKRADIPAAILRPPRRPWKPTRYFAKVVPTIPATPDPPNDDQYPVAKLQLFTMQLFNEPDDPPDPNNPNPIGQFIALEHEASQPVEVWCVNQSKETIPQNTMVGVTPCAGGLWLIDYWPCES
ncbi:MAG: hypothetical protein AAFP69_01900 [Planctomycetota bacterium]